MERKHSKIIGGVYLGMPRMEASILSSYECARRAPLKSDSCAYAKGAPRLLRTGEMFECQTCNLSAVCRSCIRWCHLRFGHRICGRKIQQKRPSAMRGSAVRRLCECSLGPSCKLMLCVCEEVSREQQCTASKLQQPVRRWLARRKLFALKLARWKMQRSVSARVWTSKVRAPVWEAIERYTDSRKESNERESMSIVDTESRASRQYMKLQVVLQAIETQKMAIGSLVAATGVLDPHPSVRELWYDPLGLYSARISENISRQRNNRGELLISPYHRYRSRQALRQAQRQYPLTQRLITGSKEEMRLTADVRL